jgi:hypothetical protein
MQTGQTTSYRPCTTTVGICRLHTIRPRFTHGQSIKSDAHLVNFLGLQQLTISHESLSDVNTKTIRFFAEINLIDEIMIFNHGKGTVESQINRHEGKIMHNHTLQICLHQLLRFAQDLDGVSRSTFCGDQEQRRWRD